MTNAKWKNLKQDNSDTEKSEHQSFSKGKSENDNSEQTKSEK